ncbi:SPJ_0845 family protein [Lactobacillus sp. LL6]|uniref:SPJ_0845 family protein n=1 Tax=Lactobacillus sp. LL6 TaxID=2596827 RepID=UPI001186A685|nr:SPJ_0845 family protein [Lactobacillus sp. LL6]TSO26217.1 hypothetical protein FOD82_03860 [Lactobacillus sp. LL6]
MGLTFDNPNNLNKMLDKFAVVPDPKKTPKKPVPKGHGPEADRRKDEENDTEDKKDKKSQK